MENIQKSIDRSLREINILYNARYHKYFPKNTPIVSKLKKFRVLEALDKYGVQHYDNTSAAEAKLLLRDYVPNNINPEILHAALEIGHNVLFTPPH